MTRVLLIDDNVDLVEALRDTLRDAGYETDIALNGVEGMAACRRTRPDVVITDIVMPEKEGVETILDLREYDPTIRIVAISGGGPLPAAANLAWAKGIGADATIEKPFREKTLLDTVARIVRSSDSGT